MVDIHTHILPALDDGADSMQEAVTMARMAYDDGIRHIVATPHHHWVPIPFKEMKSMVDALQASIDEAGIDIKIHTGHEVHLYRQTLLDLQRKHVCSLAGGSYLLVEPDFYNYDDATDKILEELFERGFDLVMAHPERILPLIGNFHKIEWFIERGGLIQLTAKSLYPNAKPDILEASIELLQNDMAHIIASDMHGKSYRPAGLKRARDIAATWVGEKKARAMVTDTPMKVITSK